MNYTQFKEEFNEQYKNIDQFMRDLEYNTKKIPWNYSIIQNNNDSHYDSYGYEDSKISKVIYFPRYNCHVMFEGTRQSYNGEEWNTMREVRLTTKTIEVYE